LQTIPEQLKYKRHVRQDALKAKIPLPRFNDANLKMNGAWTVSSPFIIVPGEHCRPQSVRCD